MQVNFTALSACIMFLLNPEIKSLKHIYSKKQYSLQPCLLVYDVTKDMKNWNKRQSQLVTKSIYIQFYYPRATFHQIYLDTNYYLTFLCLEIRSQSSTSHGFNSSGIFTFTSTFVRNCSS
jgi:hypothetical protein